MYQTFQTYYLSKNLNDEYEVGDVRIKTKIVVLMHTQNILLCKDTLGSRLKYTMIIETQCSITTLLDLILWLRGIILHSDAQVSSA